MHQIAELISKQVGQDTVAGSLLVVRQEAFAAVLKQAEGRAQYVVEGRYVEQAALAEIPEAARLAEQIRGEEPGATRHARFRLGEIINKAIIVKRAADTQALDEVLASCYVATVVREPTHELDAVHLALLVETTRSGRSGPGGATPARPDMALYDSFLRWGLRADALVPAIVAASRRPRATVGELRPGESASCSVTG